MHRRIFIFFLTILLVPCTLVLIGQSKSDESPAAKHGAEIRAAWELITEELVKGHVTYLASDELEGRGSGYPGNDKASEYIAKVFQDAGLTPVGDKGEDGKPTFWQHFTISKGTLKTRNCIGLLEGSDEKLKEEVLVIGGHHDHVGKKGQTAKGQLGSATADDKIWNGADDNASGTTAVLSIARAFGALKTRPKRSILFMTFSAEEWGLLGSKHYMNNPIIPLERVKLMINLDMVGRTTAGTKANSDLGSAACFEDLDLVVGIINRAAEEIGYANLKSRPSTGDGTDIPSDQASFAKKKIPTIGFFGGGGHPDYHKVSDHAEKINYEQLHKISRVVFLTLYDLAQVDKIPGYKKAPKSSKKKEPEPSNKEPEEKKKAEEQQKPPEKKDKENP